LAVALTLLQLFPLVSAAYTLGDYPTYLFEDNNLVAYVVVGAEAASEDVVGAVDVAVRLAAESYEEVSTGGSSTTVTGGQKEDVPLGKGIADGFLKVAMDDDDLVGLADASVTFQGTEYDFHEEILLNQSSSASPQVCTSLSCDDDDYESGVYMEVAGGAWGYYYVFDETVNVSTATSADPLEIEFLGRSIKITSISDTDTMTATVGDSYSMNVGDTVTVDGHEITLIDVSSTGSVRIDVDGEYYTVGASSTKTIGDIQVKVEDYFYRDAREDSAATLIIGDKAVQTYSDGGSYIGQDENDPDWVWDIDGLTANAAGDTTDNNGASGGVTLGIVNDYVINGDDDAPITAGGEYLLPGDYGSISFTALSVADDDYKTLKIEYESDADLSDFDSAWTSEPAFRISISGVDEGLWLDSTTSSDRVWLHFNDTADYIDVLYEDTNNQVQLHQTLYYNESSDTNTVAELDYDNTDAANDNVLLVLAGDAGTANSLNLTLDVIGDSSSYITAGADDIRINLKHSGTDFAGIGATAGANEAGEIFWGSSLEDLSTLDEDHRTYYGIIVRDPKSHGASDEVVLEIPNDEVFATIVVKGPGTTVTTAAGEAVKNVVPITTAVSRLDTEVSLPVDKPLVLVGGPAVNRLTAKALGYTYPSYGDTVTEVSAGEGYIAVTEDMVEDGQVAVVVFGYAAEDTRNACSVLQKYETFSDQLGDNVAVKVTDVSASGITAAEETTTTTTEAAAEE
jgi:hypothetical protein